ncbi:MAG: VWA domain-containing protein [Candidatus Hodarchaeota archaeon]
MDFSAKDLAALFASSDLKQSTLEILIDKLILQALQGKREFVKNIKEALKKLGISFDPILILKKFKIIEIKDDDSIFLHPIISPELNLWPHFLEILRNRFGIVVSKRMHNLGRYLKYMDTLSGQLQFLVLNLNVEREIVLDAIKGLFTIRLESQDDLMSFQEALKFYKHKENLNKKAVSALKTLGENMHLLTQDDMLYLKESMLTIDKVAAQADAVKQEFSRFSVNAFLSGVIKFDDILDFENTDELVTLSLLMKLDNMERLELRSVKETDPISRLIRKFLQRDLPKNRRKAVIRLIAKFFREFFMREGFKMDMGRLIQSIYHKELDLNKTIFKTMKKMQIWTPIYKQKIKASSRNLILVNDLSGSMISSYIGQIELFQGLIEAVEFNIDSEIVFISFSNDTFAIKRSSIKQPSNRDTFLALLTENTMGMTDINAAFESLQSGIPTRGEKFSPPNPDNTIVFFVSDMQETIGGKLDRDLVEEVIRGCKKFFLSVPIGVYNQENYEVFLEMGAIPIFYKDVTEIPLNIMKVMAMEFKE